MISCLSGAPRSHVALYYLLGLGSISCNSAPAIFANLLLEYTNYIEHYGLSRMDNERVNEKHSWQSDKLIKSFAHRP